MEETKEAITLIDWLHQYKPQLFIVAGLILTGIGGWLSFERMINYRINSISLSEENKTLGEKNETLGKENKTLGQENKELNNKIKIQSEKNGLVVKENETLGKENLKLVTQNQGLINSNILITKSNSELSNQLLDRAEVINSEITGGDSYLEITAKYQPKTDEILFEAKVRGKYNIKNASIRVTEGKNSIYDRTIDELNTDPYHEFKRIKAPKDRDRLFYQVRIMSKNGNYNQFALLKKHTDKKWYTQSVFFSGYYSSHMNYVLKERFYPYPYPEELKLKRPIPSDFKLIYDLNNEKAIESAKGYLRSRKMGFGNTMKEISYFTGVPPKVLKKLEEEINKE